jgi:hypothetical protein
LLEFILAVLFGAMLTVLGMSGGEWMVQVWEKEGIGSCGGGSCTVGDAVEVEFLQTGQHELQ